MGAVFLGRPLALGPDAACSRPIAEALGTRQPGGTMVGSGSGDTHPHPRDVLERGGGESPPPPTKPTSAPIGPKLNGTGVEIKTLGLFFKI